MKSGREAPRFVGVEPKSLGSSQKASGAPPLVADAPRPDAHALNSKKQRQDDYSVELPRNIHQSKGVSPNSLPSLTTLRLLLCPL